MQAAKLFAVSDFPDGLPLDVSKVFFQPGQARGQRGKDLFRDDAPTDLLQQLAKRDGALTVEGADVDLGMLDHADGIDDDKVSLATGVLGYRLELGLTDDAGATPHHLLEKVGRVDAPHKEQDL